MYVESVSRTIEATRILLDKCSKKMSMFKENQKEMTYQDRNLKYEAQDILEENPCMLSYLYFMISVHGRNIC